MLDLLIITGASRGIGASIVSKCASICKNMIVIGSSEKIFDVSNNSCNVIPIQLDLSYDFNFIKYTISQSILKLKNINSLGIVLCAAQLGNPGGLLGADLDNWAETYNCNVLGNLAVVQGCSSIIKNGAKTRIAMFAGGGAANSFPEFSAYSLSKVAVVRAVENLADEFNNLNLNASIIAVAPGAVATDMLSKVIANGGTVKTRTDISEPTNFIHNFLTDKFESNLINGRFLHVRDKVSDIDFSSTPINLFKLRRVE